MYPRDLLKQCFKCRHNVQCWKLDKDIPSCKSEKEVRWSIDKIIYNINRLQKTHEIEYAGDYLGMFAVMGIDALNKPLHIDKEYKHDAVFNVLFMYCAMTNTSNDGWECPGDYRFESIDATQESEEEKD